DVDRIVIAHQHDRRFLVAAAEVAHHGERLLQALPRFQRTLRVRLDGGAVGHRIAERHAKLDHIGTGAGQRAQNRRGSPRIGVARGDEGDECGTALASQRGETAVNAGCHNPPPRYCATECRSLSPRPDRFTTIRWSFAFFGASSKTLAMACADSSAGMMPSSFERA